MVKGRDALRAGREGLTPGVYEIGSESRFEPICVFFDGVACLPGVVETLAGVSLGVLPALQTFGVVDLSTPSSSWTTPIDSSLNF